MFKLTKAETAVISGGGDVGQCFCKIDIGNAICSEIELKRWESGDSFHELCGSLCCNSGYAAGWKYEYNEIQKKVIPYPFEIVELPLVFEERC